jgi:hypothetical protein
LSHYLYFKNTERKAADDVGSSSNKASTQQPPNPTNSQKLRYDGISDGDITDVVNLEAEFEEDEFETWTQTRVDIPTGVTANAILAFFITAVGFLIDKSFLNDVAHKMFLVFDSEAAYKASLDIACPHGTIYNPPDYDPKANQSIYHRAMYMLLGNIPSLDVIKRDINTATGASVSACRINDIKKTVSVYFDGEDAWKLALKHHAIPLPSASSQPTHLRTMLSLAATSDQSWTRLWISKLPANASVSATANFLWQRLGVRPEILALYIDPNNKVRNFGFIMSKTPIIIERLLNATDESLTIRNSIRGDKVVVIQRALRKSNPRDGANQ